MNASIQDKLRPLSDDQLTDFILNAIAVKAARMTPMDFKGWFCGAIAANVVGNLSDRDFEQFCEVLPCHKPGCDCVKVSQAATDFAKLIRRDFKNEMTLRVSRN